MATRPTKRAGDLIGDEILREQLSWMSPEQLALHHAAVARGGRPLTVVEEIHGRQQITSRNEQLQSALAKMKAIV
jgi:hypothetical protein